MVHDARMLLQECVTIGRFQRYIRMLLQTGASSRAWFSINHFFFDSFRAWNWTSWNLVTLDQLKVSVISRPTFICRYNTVSNRAATLLARPKSGSNIFFESQWPKTSDLLLYVVYDCIQSSFEGLKLKGFWMKSPKIGPEMCFGSLLWPFQACLIGLEMIFLS